MKLTLGVFFLSLDPLRVQAEEYIELSAEEAHDALYQQTDYPTAAACKTCHPVHYKEWSASPHAYAMISPVFNSMQAKINQLTNGTNGDFCIRCHTPIGMDKHEPVFMSTMDRDLISREGITCVTCHRRTQPYGKVSSRMSIKKGDIFDPVYGSSGNNELKRIIESGEYKINTQRGEEGRDIHTEAIKMPQISESAFCGSCHDVNGFDGFRLEEAFSQYKSSPAAAKGVSCQDCHMGKTPGANEGYFEEPIAFVAGKPTRPRKRTNHSFVGPDYSIVHPGIFPHNTAAVKIATMRQWLKFMYIDGWGTDDFEDEVTDEDVFPEPWDDQNLRYEARQILDENIERLEEMNRQRHQLLRTGYQLGNVVVSKADSNGIDFRVEVKNGTDGHNVPTGFDAERLVFLQTTVKDKNGQVVFQSGDLDPNGDVRDLHSIYVHNGELPLDKQLFSLQSKFITHMIRGGDREQILAVNYSEDPLPFIRPPVVSTHLLGRPTNARKHRKTIPPLSSKWASYSVEGAVLDEKNGPYTANIKLIAGMVPVNLVYEIQDMGFDYDMSPRDVADAITAGHQVLWERELTLVPGDY